MSWATVGEAFANTQTTHDSPEWHALILIEVVSLLVGRLRHYPVEIVDAPEVGLVRVAARADPDLDRWRVTLARSDAAADLQREMVDDIGAPERTLAILDALTLGSSTPQVSLDDVTDDDGGRLYVFRYEGTLPAVAHVLLRPRPDSGTVTAVRRRLRHIAAARGNLDLLRAIGDPCSVAMNAALRDMAPPGDLPDELDGSKANAWKAIRYGHSLDLVVGPRGVGKTFLVSRLAGSILDENPDARILIAAQNHDAVAEMERKLREHLGDHGPIIVRVEKSIEGSDDTPLRGEVSPQDLRSRGDESAPAPATRRHQSRPH